MPLSTPGPYRRSSVSGQPSRTWLQRVIFPCASGSNIAFSSATVISFAQSFFGFTTTASPS